MLSSAQLSTQQAVVLPTPHPGQTELLRNKKRFTVAACGRRWGKTIVGLILCIEVAARGGHVWWVAPSYPVATIIWRDLKSSIGANVWERKNETERRIEFWDGSITVKSGDKPDSLVAAGLDYIVYDEIGLMKNDVWNISRPALSDRHGGALFIGTPRGKNWFWRFYQRGLSDDDGEWVAFHRPTSDNPYINPEEIESAKRDLPNDIFRQEYLAEFLDDGGQVFRNVRACIGEPPAETPRVVIGADWAQVSDFTVFAVVDIATGAAIEMDRFSQIDWHTQRGRLTALSKRHGDPYILAELNSIGSPNVEELQRSGLRVSGFTTTNDTKAQIIQALVLAFERGDIIIPEDPRLIAELEAFEATRLPSGRWRYSAPDGMHDDMVIALALAWWARQGAKTKFAAASIEQTSRFADAMTTDRGRGSRWKDI